MHDAASSPGHLLQLLLLAALPLYKRINTAAASLEVPVKAHEACQLEEWVVGLLVQLAAPIPGTGQAPVDAAAGVKEVLQGTNTPDRKV